MSLVFTWYNTRCWAWREEMMEPWEHYICLVQNLLLQLHVTLESITMAQIHYPRSSSKCTTFCQSPNLYISSFSTDNLTFKLAEQHRTITLCSSFFPLLMNSDDHPFHFLLLRGRVLNWLNHSLVFCISFFPALLEILPWQL